MLVSITSMPTATAVPAIRSHFPSSDQYAVTLLRKKWLQKRCLACPSGELENYSKALSISELCFSKTETYPSHVPAFGKNEA